MRVMHIDSSVITIELDGGISVRMFPETASILFKQLWDVLHCLGYEERARDIKESPATDRHQLNQGNSNVCNTGEEPELYARPKRKAKRNE